MIDHKFWWQVHRDMMDQKSVLTDEADFYGLTFQDYFILHRVLYHSRPKRIGWIGGFSNLDFFIPQRNVDSITDCTNVDHTPVTEWCKNKHKHYIEKYQYKGQYRFIEEKYEKDMLTDVDFLSTLTGPLSDLPLDKFDNLSTLVTYHYGSPRNINTVQDKFHSMPQRIITNNIVVYSVHDLGQVTDDCELLTRIGESEIGKSKNGIFVDREYKSNSWQEKLSGLSTFKKLTK